MLAGHLTVAGLAELVVSAGVIAYLQRSEPHLLRVTAPGASVDEPGFLENARPWHATKSLWIVVAILTILTPLGIVAIGSAWGEWSAADFSDPQSRQQIAAASGGQAPPATAPAGLESLTHLWTPLIPLYAPAFLKNAAVGYIVSAVVGIGLIFGAVLLTGLFIRRFHRTPGFIERTLGNLVRASEYAANAEQISEAGGALQRIDPRVKLVGVLGLIIAVAASQKLWVIGAIFAFSIGLAMLSRIVLAKLSSWVWAPVLFFTGMIALPAVFLTSGDPVWTWGRIQISAQGIRSATFLITRAETAATLSGLLVLSTPWPWVLKSLRIFRFPMALVATLGMAYRYIFVILQSALDMFESRRSRTVGELTATESRRMAASAVGVLLSKSFQLSGEVHLAMQSRGFAGEVHVLQDFRASAADWGWLAGFVILALGGLWWGRG
jgi:cobalt ECF transporter T component CbiQ